MQAQNSMNQHKNQKIHELISTTQKEVRKKEEREKQKQRENRKQKLELEKQKEREKILEKIAASQVSLHPVG